MDQPDRYEQTIEPDPGLSGSDGYDSDEEPSGGDDE
jgi:hypothetical protein